MLYNIFPIILKMSCVASIIAILLLSAKFIFQKIGFPRKIMFLLWGIIAFRLICPIVLSSDLSVFNIPSAFENYKFSTSLQQTERTVDTNGMIKDEVSHNGIADISDTSKSTERFKTIKYISTVVWFAGMCTMLLIGALSYMLLKKRLRFSIRLKDNIYSAENIPTSFVFGVFRPKIFIPENIQEQDMANIIIHEQTHLKRADHITKIVAYLILSIHWFNPLCWVMFKLFSDDMELACDETLMQKIGIENKKRYLNTLLNNSVNKQKTILLYHVCFSANPTKRRVKNMIKLKKHSKFMAVLGIIICLFSTIVFATNATEQKTKETDVGTGQNIEQPLSLQNTPIPIQTQNTPTPVNSTGTADIEFIEQSLDVTDNTLQANTTRSTPKPQKSDNTKNKKSKSNNVTDTKDDTSSNEPKDTPSNIPQTTSPPSVEASTNVYAEVIVDKEKLTDIEMGMHIEDIHKTVGVENRKNSENSNTEMYQLDDGNTAVLVYENDELKRGYILKDSN